MPRFGYQTDKAQHQANTFPCWVAARSETPHHITLYLKFHGRPESVNDYNIQAELTKEKWSLLQTIPFPWQLQLDPTHLILMSNGSEANSTSTPDLLGDVELVAPPL